jgi:hypothetical protein
MINQIISCKILIAASTPRTERSGVTLSQVAISICRFDIKVTNNQTLSDPYSDKIQMYLIL